MMGPLFKLLLMGSRGPRRQQLSCTRKEMVDDVFAVIRLAWFRDSKQYQVEELQVTSDCKDKVSVVQSLIHEALKAGADVSVITDCDPANLGFK